MEKPSLSIEEKIDEIIKEHPGVSFKKKEILNLIAQCPNSEKLEIYTESQRMGPPELTFFCNQYYCTGKCRPTEINGRYGRVLGKYKNGKVTLGSTNISTQVLEEAKKYRGWWEEPLENPIEICSQPKETAHIGPVQNKENPTLAQISFAPIGTFPGRHLP